MSLRDRFLRTVMTLALGCLAPEAWATRVDFDFAPSGDPILAPELFEDATALRDLYAPLGVLFLGPGPLDGGAILDQDSNFLGAVATSGRNFLAFNPTDVFLADGGRPWGPETIVFTVPVTHVSMMVFGGNPVTVEAYDASDTLVDSVTDPFALVFRPLSLSSSSQISRLSVTGGTFSFLIDDLEFRAVSEPATAALFAGGLLLGVVRRRRPAS